MDKHRALAYLMLRIICTECEDVFIALDAIRVVSEKGIRMFYGSHNVGFFVEHITPTLTCKCVSKTHLKWSFDYSARYVSIESKLFSV